MTSAQGRLAVVAYYYWVGHELAEAVGEPLALGRPGTASRSPQTTVPSIMASLQVPSAASGKPASVNMRT